jgi:hypothetical protein
MDYSIFGCRLNKYYLNQWLEYFRSHDFPDIERHNKNLKSSEGFYDVELIPKRYKPYLITTCEVTDRAKQKRVKLAKKKLAE